MSTYSHFADASRAGDKYETSSTNVGYSKFMKLKIRNVSAADFGSYRCVAKNSLGETDGLIKLDGKANKIEWKWINPIRYPISQYNIDESFWFPDFPLFFPSRTNCTDHSPNHRTLFEWNAKW